MDKKKINEINFAKLKMNQIKHIHFVGIGGAGMCGIAEILAKNGYQVSGSDLVINSITQQLKLLGIKIYFNHCSENIRNANVVVVSNAIPSDNPEIIAAYQSRIPVISRAEMLSEIIRFNYSIAIAGTHGKTTTTAMIFNIYKEAGLDPTFINGGLLKDTGTYAYLGKGNYIIVEADESDASFLYLKPILVIITSIDYDHMNYYQNSLENLKKAFIKFIHNIPFYGIVVLCLDDPKLREIIPFIKRKIITYGFNKHADVRIKKYYQIKQKGYFTIVNHDKILLQVEINIPGYHNALNAAASIAVAIEEGIDHKTILNALKNFNGISRRFDLLGEFSLKPINGKPGSVILIDDYGHHPTELNATIKTARVGWPEKNIIMLFQPHRFTRTRDLYNDFVNVLSQVDILLMLDIYPAGEKPIPGIDSYSLCCSIRKKSKIDPILISNPTKITKILSLILNDNDLILTQGAGSIGTIACILAKIELKP